MRTIIRAAIASVMAVVSFVGPVSAATHATVVAQATQATGTISGRVVDSRSKPLGGASINISGPSTVQTTSDADGRFTAKVQAGLYTIVINKGGFSSAQSDDIVVPANATISLSLTMREADLQSLRVIGRTSGTSTRNPINIDSVAVTTLSQQAITDRQQPNLNEIVGELPGVFTNRDTTGRTPNSGFIVRGSAVETKTQINGHGVSSGVFGTFNSNYTSGEIFDNVEVTKGPGLTGANAGESAVGTVNLRTRSIQPGNHADFKVGVDGLGGSSYSAVVNLNTTNDRLGVVFVKTARGVRSTADGYTANRIGSAPASTVFSPTGGGPALIGWQGDLTDRFTTLGELVKARYRLSNATSLTAEFLGSHGKYQPQGGSYAIYDGANFTVPQCIQTGVAILQGQPGCSVTSNYNSPTAINQIGQTVPMYNWFPNSELAYNEPEFDLELRTSIKNDTILVRPYSALINRFINGQYENYQPGYQNNGWYAVTNAANCVVGQPQNLGNAAGIAKGPCFTAGQGALGSIPYIAPGGAPSGTVFAYQSTNAPACGPVVAGQLPVCYTSGISQQNNGLYGFSTPFSQPEVDRLRGGTFTYLHPVKDNVYSFSVDYQKDDTIKQSNDTTTPPVGCVQVIGSGVANAGANAQAACSINGIPFISIPQIGLQIPPTQTYKFDYSATGLFQLTPALQLGIGNYLTVQRIAAQYSNPALVAVTGSATKANASLIALNRTQTHYDPHLTLEYHPTSSIALRAAAGTGTTVPYAGQISGFARSNGVSGSDVFNIQQPNPNLLPETTVAYNVGADLRQPDGGVFTVDAFNNTTHNVFIQLTQVTPALVGIPNTDANTVYTTSLQYNGPIQRNYGLEITSKKTPILGFGYNATMTFQRAYLDQLPLSYYGSFNAAGVYTGNFRGGVNGKQLDGSISNSAIPYTKGRLEVNYAAQHDTFLGLGMSFYGSNNSYRDTGLAFFNAVARTGIGNGFRLQVSAENLFNYSTGNFIGATVNLAGPVPVGVRVNADGTSTYGGAFGPTTTANSTQIVPPRNVQIILQKRI